MARFVAVDLRSNTSLEIDFAEAVTLLKGSVISSMAAGDGFVEVGVSERTNVRFQVDKSGDVAALLFSTLNPGDIPPLKVALVSQGEQLTAYLVEKRLRGMRQLYAINYLVRNGRAEELAKALLNDDSVDVERFLLKAKEQLYIQAAGPGSFWVTVLTQSKHAYEAAKLALVLPFKEGHEALVRRVQADTHIRELSVGEKALDIDLKRANGLIEVADRIEKIKDKQMRETVKRALLKSLDDFGRHEQTSLEDTPENGSETGPKF